MRIFRLDASIRSEGSVSRTVADAAEAVWRDAGAAEFVRRDLGQHPLPSVWLEAATSRFTPPEARTEGQLAATALGAELIDELLACDAFLFAVPMYNFGVPQQVKHWVDMLITDQRAADVDIPLLPGRPALLATVCGDAYGTDSPRAGWDHATPFLQHILGGVLGLDLATVTAELTTPTAKLAARRDEGPALRAAAIAAAERHAHDILDRLATPVG